MAQKARGGGDFVLKDDRDSKNGTGKGQMGADRLPCHPSRSRHLLQEVNSIKRLKGWARIYRCSFSSFSRDNTVLGQFFSRIKKSQSWKGILAQMLI